MHMTKKVLYNRWWVWAIAGGIAFLLGQWVGFALGL